MLLTTKLKPARMGDSASTMEERYTELTDKYKKEITENIKEELEEKYILLYKEQEEKHRELVEKNKDLVLEVVEKNKELAVKRKEQMETDMSCYVEATAVLLH